MLNTVTFQNIEGYQSHCLLRAIDQNTLLSRLDYETVGHKSELFYTRTEILKKYEAFPVLVSNTEKHIADCSIVLDLTSNKNRQYYNGNKSTDIKLLEKLAYRYGLTKRKMVVINLRLKILKNELLVRKLMDFI
jgi:hypothetical protein